MLIKLKKYGVILGVAVVLLIGSYFRFYKITEDQFFYFDEGYYLGFNRVNAEIVEKHLPLSLSDLWKVMVSNTVVALGSTKPLWLFLIDLRVYFFGVEGWSFPRVLSAVCGIITVAVSYIFAKKYYRSDAVALLTLVVLSFLPSHVFYSRMALQEGMSTLLFLLGFYFYLFPRKLFVKVLLPAVFFAGVYYTNYRLIIVPVLLVFTEIIISLIGKQKMDARRVVWTIVIFCVFVFGFGNLGRADNTYAAFAWMFHQADLAKENFSLVNYFSYPYYLICFESFLFFAFFFAGGSFFLKKHAEKAFPFLMCLFVMVLFSLAMEKGARYICIIFPFMSMAVSFAVVSLYQSAKNRAFRIGLVFFVVLMLSVHLHKSWINVHFNSDYESSMRDIIRVDPQAKVMSNQAAILGLFAPRDRVVSTSDKYDFFRAYFRSGYKYLVIEPQTYIALSSDRKRFGKKLIGYLDFIDKSMPPIKEYPHFSALMMERFVFEHSENLLRSIDFLKANEGGKFGRLRVFDAGQCTAVMDQFVNLKRRMRQ